MDESAGEFNIAVLGYEGGLEGAVEIEPQEIYVLDCDFTSFIVIEFLLR